MGASLERTVGEYWIDIGYDPVQPRGGDRMVFDFNLADAAATSTRVQFDYVWVRLQNENQTLLASGIHRAEIGPTSLLYSLPRNAKGELTMHVRYQRGNDALAEADFIIPVAAYEDPRWWYPFLGCAVLGAVVGFFGMFAFILWRRRHSPL
jgi:hypothetical protein